MKCMAQALTHGLRHGLHLRSEQMGHCRTGFDVSISKKAPESELDFGSAFMCFLDLE